MKIREIDLPSTCTNLVPYMFADCSELETVVIPFEVEIIPKSFLQNSPKIHHIYVNGEELFHQNILDFNSFNITEIGDFAFQNVSHVTHIIFDGRNLVIGSGAFSSLTLTRSIEFINFPKIFNCSSNAFPRNTISSVIFPPGIFKFMVPDWDWNTMFNSDSETLDTSKFQYDPSPTLSNVHDNFALSNDDAYLVKCLIASGDVNVPDSVALVVQDAFSSCYEVDVTFGDESKLQWIQQGAFKNSQITSLSLPPSFKNFAPELFKNLTFLTSVHIKSDITELPSSLFFGCSSLASIKHQSNALLENKILDLSKTNISWIGKNCFSGVLCETLIISENLDLRSVNGLGISRNTHLKEVEFDFEVSEFSPFAFKGCTSLEKILIKNKIVLSKKVLDLTDIANFIIGYSAFSGVDIERIVFSTHSIFSYSSFYDCNVSVADYVPFMKPFSDSIDTIAFPHQIYHISTLTTFIYSGMVIANQSILYIPPTVSVIRSPACSKMSSFTKFIISNSVNSLPPFAFDYCLCAQHIEVHHPFKDIPHFCFGGCFDLSLLIVGENNVISNGVLNLSSFSSIGYHAFRCIRTFSTIIVPNCIIFGDGAFSGTYAVEIKFLDDPFTCKLSSPYSAPFSGCSHIQTLNISNSYRNDLCQTLEDTFSVLQLFTGSSLQSKRWSSFVDCRDDPYLVYQDPYQRILKECNSLVPFVRLPSNIQIIQPYAFKNSYAATVSFDPNSNLYEVIEFAFKQSRVTKVIFPKGFSFVPYENFLRNSLLLSVEFLSKIISFQGNCFNQCKQLQSIIIDRIPVLYDGVFDVRDSSLRTLSFDGILIGVPFTRIILSDQIDDYQKFPFALYPQLKCIEIRVNITQWDPEFNFQNLPNLEDLIVANYYLIRNHTFILSGAPFALNTLSNATMPIFSNCSITGLFLDTFQILDPLVVANNPISRIDYIILNSALSLPKWFFSFPLTSLYLYGYQTLPGRAIPDSQYPHDLIDFSGTPFQYIDPELPHILTNFTKIYLPMNYSILQSSLFANVWWLDTLSIPYPVRIIPESFLENCSSLRTLLIGGKVILSDGILTLASFTSISKRSFSGIPIQAIKLSTEDLYLGNEAFAHCKELSFVFFIDVSNTMAFGETPFLNCLNLKSVSLPSYPDRYLDFDFKKLFADTPLINIDFSSFVRPTESNSFSQSENFTPFIPPNEPANSNKDTNLKTLTIILTSCIAFVVVFAIFLVFIFRKKFKFKQLEYSFANINDNQIENPSHESLNFSVVNSESIVLSERNDQYSDPSEDALSSSRAN